MVLRTGVPLTVRRRRSHCAAHVTGLSTQTTGNRPSARELVDGQPHGPRDPGTPTVDGCSNHAELVHGLLTVTLKVNEYLPFALTVVLFQTCHLPRVVPLADDLLPRANA